MPDEKQEDTAPPDRRANSARPRTPFRAVVGWGACLFTAVVFCLWQFRADHFGPLFAAAVILGVVWYFRPYLGPLCLHIWLFGAALFLADVFWLRHRLAISARIWHPLFQDSVLLGVYPSPSGKSTVYSIGTGFLDAVEVIYISDGGWFPRAAADYRPPTVDPTAPTPWSGSLYTLRHFRYDEATGEITVLPLPESARPSW